MPFIQGSLSYLQPLVDVSIGSPLHAHDRTTCRALIDTGATRTCVSRRLVSHHNLEPRGRMLMQTAGTHASQQTAYAFTVGLFCLIKDRLGNATTLHVLDQEFAAPLIEDNDSCDVLIGMDLLIGGKLVMQGQDFRFDF